VLFRSPQNPKTPKPQNPKKLKYYYLFDQILYLRNKRNGKWTLKVLCINLLGLFRLMFK